MIEIRTRVLLDLLDNELFFAESVKLRNEDKLSLTQNYNPSYMSDGKVKFTFSDEKDELAFNLKFGHLFNE